VWKNRKTFPKNEAIDEMTNQSFGLTQLRTSTWLTFVEPHTAISGAARETFISLDRNGISPGLCRQPRWQRSRLAGTARAHKIVWHWNSRTGNADETAGGCRSEIPRRCREELLPVLMLAWARERHTTSIKRTPECRTLSPIG